MSQRSAVCTALLVCACSNADGELGGIERGTGSSYADGRLPVPGCERFDYGACDIREAACVDNLAAIAHCLRGSDTALPMPEVLYVSQAEAELALASLFPPERPAEINHFEVALTQLGLTRPGALSPMARAARYAREWAAFYSHAQQAIVVIEHATPLDALSENVVLIHEMIHALQDAEHDLEAFSERHRLGVDAELQGSCLVEGEARLHERRYFAARAGLNAAEVDFQRSFDNLRDASERWLFEQEDLYSASQLSVPYAHGAAYVFDVWSEGGSSGVRALFDAHPSGMRDILASSWGGERAVALEQFQAPTEPPSGLGVEPSLGETTPEAWMSMGAWGIYLLVQPKLDDLELARGLALSWRGDLLEVFSLAGGETVARWQVRLDNATDAARFVDALRDMPGVTASQAAAQVTLLTTPSL